MMIIVVVVFLALRARGHRCATYARSPVTAVVLPRLATIRIRDAFVVHARLALRSRSKVHPPVRILIIRPTCCQPCGGPLAAAVVGAWACFEDAENTAPSAEAYRIERQTFMVCVRNTTGTSQPHGTMAWLSERDVTHDRDDRWRRADWTMTSKDVRIVSCEHKRNKDATTVADKAVWSRVMQRA
jgi:hypothetical protein